MKRYIGFIFAAIAGAQKSKKVKIGEAVDGSTRSEGWIQEFYNDEVGK